MLREQSKRHSRIDRLTMYYLGDGEEPDDIPPDDTEDEEAEEEDNHDTPINVKSSSEEELDKPSLRELLQDEKEEELNSDDEDEVVEKITVRVCCRPILIDPRIWKAIIYMITFGIHFFSVLGILAGGAVIFAYLEDGEYLVDRANQTESLPTITNSTVEREEYFKRVLWKDIETRFNISVKDEVQESLIQHFRDYFNDAKKRQEELSERRDYPTRIFIFQKWLYFVTIATTTIGYGDLSPKTDDGKLFYIFFSIVGIVLMMTLLRRCGTVISAINRILFNLITKLIDRYVGRKSNDETVAAILSLFTTLIIFGGYFVAGFWYGKEMLRENWSILDQFYFWVVTLTTVGFGDLLLSIEEEVENMSFYLVYRLFGLAILASIIDAIEEVVKAFDKKREKLKRKLNKMKKQTLEKAKSKTT